MTLPKALESRGLETRFFSLCAPNIPASRVIKWLKTHTGENFSTLQVKAVRTRMGCPAARGAHRSPRGGARLVSLRGRGAM